MKISNCVGYMVVLVASLVVSSCQTPMPMDQTTVNQIGKEMKDAKDSALASSEKALNDEIDQKKQLEKDQQKKAQTESSNLNASVTKWKKGKVFDVSVSKLSAKAFFMSLVADTPVNMIVHPDVAGQISVTLKRVTIEEALDAVSDVYGYHIEKSSYGYRVYPAQLVTQIYQLNYLNVKRQGFSATSVSSGEITKNGGSSSGSASSSSESGGGGNASTSKGSSVETESNADFWDDLKNILTLILGNKPNREVVVNAQSGIVVVKAFPKEHRNIKDFIKIAESNLQRQVIIEAKILEVELTDGFQSGINWTQIGKHGNDHSKTSTIGVAGETLLNPDNISGVFSINLALNDFTSLIQLLETQGEVHVLSSPRISTVNNQKAVIKVGTDEFFVTELKSNTTTSGSSSTVSPEVTLTPFFSGIALDVTPQVGDDDEITLHIHPTVSEVTDQTKLIDLGNSSFSLPLAFSSVRESDSIIRAKNEQIVVIGGLLQNRVKDTHSRVPILADLPFIGGAFQQKRKTSVRSELVILLKPKIVNRNSWTDALEQSSRHFEDLKQHNKHWDLF